jgi:hypothetical protein
VIWAADAPAGGFADPSFLVNLGVAGAILVAFFSGRLHSTNEMDRVERACNLAAEAQKDAHDVVMQRLDDHIRRLIVERDRALAERDEMIGVMKDFTMMAGAVLNQDQPWRQKPRSQPPPRRGDTQS